MTTVEKEQFWTQIVENPSLWGTIQTSDNSFNTQAENIWTVMNETFIKNGSLKEVNRWELMLGDRLENSGEGTLNERKSRILKRITEHPPISRAVLQDKMGKIIADHHGHVFQFDYDEVEDKLDIRVVCKEENETSITEIISSIMPKIKNVNITFDDLYKYANCTTIDEMIAINSEYKNDVTVDGEWIYPLPELENAKSLFKGATYLKKLSMTFPKVVIGVDMFLNSGIKELDITMPKATGVMHWINGCNLTKLRIVMPNCTSAESLLCCGSSVQEIYADVPSVTNMNYGIYGTKIQVIKSPHGSVPMNGNNDGYGNDTLVEYPWALPNLKYGKGLFLRTKLNKESALRILKSIPSWGDNIEHLLTIGIHIDNQYDEEILAAVEEAETKGWQMTVAWNGTPTTQTSSTYGLRRHPIYAKSDTRTTPNGVVETYLNWGHYVTSWEENSYQEFSSLEEAYEYFGIEPEV